MPPGDRHGHRLREWLFFLQVGANLALLFGGGWRWYVSGNLLAAFIALCGGFGLTATLALDSLRRRGI